MRYEYVFIIVTFLVLIIVASCKSKSSLINESKTDLTVLINQTFSEKPTCIPNESETFHLCYAYDDPIMDPDRLVFVVINTDNEIIINKTRVNGIVEWSNNETLKLEKWSRNANKQGTGRKKTIEYKKVINSI